MSDPALHLFVGYLGSALVVTSLAMRSIVRLRIVGLAGALTFTVYGVLITAWPVVLTNAVILLIHSHFLREILIAKEYFRVLEVRQESQYLKYFLESHRDEIQSIWSGFSFQPSPRLLTLFVLRDLVPAGLFIAEIEDEETIRLQLDFAIPGYRDFKIGNYLYERGTLFERGFRRVIVEAGSGADEKYLRRLGFRRPVNPGRRDVLERSLEPGS
ncbi:MAG: hypothetical protein OEM23_07965 [Gemmatimonadota bacterium]|nr:hypothetical protein [Gemmatimonadota bacterium]MDH3428356.1 hypothetical protein [Gemmatimonadota bacterium]